MDVRRGRIETSISVDEVGVETAYCNGTVLKSACQPIFERCGGMLEIWGVEALARPSHDGAAKDDELPADIDMADQTFVAALCRTLHLRNYRNLGNPGLRLLFGLDPKLCENVEADLREAALCFVEAGGDLALLACRITGTGMLADDALREIAAHLRELGMAIVVDDFAGGDSTIRDIELLRPDIVSFDGAWLRRVASFPAAARLLPALFRSCAGQGSRVLVYGIETMRDLDAALEAGADLVQGFLLGRPALVGAEIDAEPMAVPVRRFHDREASRYGR